jgi:hypothetical protein
MLTLADKKTLFQDRYQALLLPVPTSGTFRQRHLLQVQKLYPAFYAQYKRSCERSELQLGSLLQHTTERDLAGLGVSSALAKPKFIVGLAVTEFAQNAIHLSSIQQVCQQLEPVLFNWGRYQGIRRVALLGSDEVLLPDGADFEQEVLPLLERYLQPVSTLNLVIYR